MKVPLSICHRGRNVEGQCGVEMGAVIPFPMPILELMGSPVTQIVAGKLSTGVLMGGEAWTFGSSSAGQLGLGTCVGAVVVPSRVSGICKDRTLQKA